MLPRALALLISGLSSLAHFRGPLNVKFQFCTFQRTEIKLFVALLGSGISSSPNCSPGPLLSKLSPDHDLPCLASTIEKWCIYIYGMNEKAREWMKKRLIFERERKESECQARYGREIHKDRPKVALI